MRNLKASAAEETKNDERSRERERRHK